MLWQAIAIAGLTIAAIWIVAALGLVYMLVMHRSAYDHDPDDWI
jgi:hypothetical protein